MDQFYPEQIPDDSQCLSDQ